MSTDLKPHALTTTASEATDTRGQFMDVAEQLLLERGYAGFSYQDIADAIGIRKASIHHHFAAKEDLGAAIVKRARERLLSSRGAVATTAPEIQKQFDRFLRFFEKLAMQGDRLCIGGRLSADLAVLPEAVRDPFRGFIVDNSEWLAELFDAGQRLGVFKRDAGAADQALMLGAAVQGAVQVARARGDVEYFRRIVRQLRQQFLLDAQQN
jgi:TetR/AcrR family transcriptional repressor of nem operon